MTTATQRRTWRIRNAFTTKAIKRELHANRARTFTLELSFPPSELMQNRSAGKHWAFSHPAKVTMKQEAYLATRQAITESGFELNPDARYRIEMMFHPADKRRRDVSNLHAAMKAALDGIAEAMGIDDSHFRPHQQDMGEVRYRPCVIVTVAEVC